MSDRTDSSSQPAPAQATQAPVAIVGIGVLFPKSPDLQTYWKNIVGAVDCISEVPAGHSWAAEDYYDADPSAKDKSWATRGGFVEKVPFDPIEHGVPPNMLESIDTTQLLSLIVARECLKDAGLDPDGEGWDRDRVACILGITGTQEMAVTAGSRLQGPIWRKALQRCGITGELQDAIVSDIGNHFPTWTEQTFPGLLGNVVAGRIASRLDLGGTNCVVDAACASSLAAMQYAIGDLASGRSDLVLSGGADMLNDAFMFQCFTRTPAFTKKGDARPFDAEADGILIGEGIAVVALKRLADAERDGDRVYAVIRGLGSSSDGRGKSIYAPASSGQAKALRRTYAMAGISTDTVELVEAHGTGTKAGDAAEIAGLRSVYEAGERTDRWVALGSVKSQVGHTKSTAGAAGLVKAALALHHRMLPPTAKIDTPNPKMDFEHSPFYLSGRARPWIRAADHPRRAAVSAFGFGGSNFHALLEEHGPTDVSPAWAAEGELFLFGADSAADLRAQLDAVEASAAPTFSHTARAVHEQWTPGKAHVLGFVVEGQADWAKKRKLAQAALDGAVVPGVHYGADLSTDAPAVAFVFPGQGSQYVEMGRTAALRHPSLRSALDDADEHFRQAGQPSLSSRIFPPPAFTEAESTAQEAALRATEHAQPALGALSVGWLRTLAHFGIQPNLTAGHSYGELVALHAAGALDFDGLMTASRLRGQRMAALAEDLGTMAAVTGELSAIEAAISGIDGLVLANRNHPSQGVISGARDAVAAGIAACEQAGLEAKPIAVGAAFHSPLVADAAAPFAADLKQIAVSKPALPVWSTVTAKPHGKTAASIRSKLAEQITAPVDWVGVVEGLYEAGARVFVECGPKGVLAGLVRTTLGHRAQGPDRAHVVAVDPKRHKADGDVQLKEALAALAAAGLPVSLAPLLAERLPAPPRTAGSIATTWLGGANHKNPSTLEPPMPKVPKAPAPRPVAPKAPAADPVAAAGWGAIPTSGTAVSKPPALAKSITDSPAPFDPSILGGSPAAAPQAPASSPALPAGELAALLDSTRSTLAAFQQAQTRTAEVHAKFLDAWTESSKNFSQLFEAHARLVEAAAGSVPAGGRPVAPASVAQAAHAPPPVVGPLLGSSATPAPSAASSLPGFGLAGSAPAAPAPSAPASIAPVGAAPAAKGGLGHLFAGSDGAAADGSKAPAVHSTRSGGVLDLPPLLDAAMAVSAKSAPRAPVARAQPAGPSRERLVSATLDAVAGKTGYPLEMLELTMDLESDLGVDSIKRVEILGAVSDAVPTLPELDNERMGALRTLDEVVSYLAEVAGSLAAPAAAPAPSGPSAAQLTTATLDAVATKTGYPLEMLELTMDLESDLGVDSIKRVEILGAVSDAIPELPELDNERMGALRTLQEVVDYLVESMGDAPGPAAPASGPSAALLTDATLDAVASKTGYPREMLELTMDLESDLGVDSIKRVEILGAVSDAVPELPELDNERMGALRTLQEVVDYLVESVGGSPDPDPTPPGADPFTTGLYQAKKSTTRAELEGALLDAVAAKTGYPRGMLELTMDLESDLGVDSIKRVEILGAVNEAIPTLPELDNEALGKLRTLADVLDHLASVGAGLGFAHLGSHKVPADPSAMLVMPPAAPQIPQVAAGLPPIRAAAEYAAEAVEPVGLRRRVVRAVVAPDGHPVPLVGPVLVTDDLHGRSAALATLLTDRGLQVVRIDPDWSDDAAVAAAIPVEVGTVIHLAAAGAPEDQAEARVRGAFLVARATGPVSAFVTVSAMGGRFGLDGEHGWLEGGLAGLPKTLAHEWPTTRCLALDIAPDLPAEALANALITDRGAVEIGLCPAPVVLRTVNQALPTDGPGSPLEPGDLVVVSGGARGVTAAVVIALASRTPAHFLLLGRSALQADPTWAEGIDDAGLQAAWMADCKARGAKPVPKELQADLDRVRRQREVRSTLAAIEAAGATVRYTSADIRDPKSVGAAVQAAVEAHGPVRGIVHGAGVLADKLVVDKPVDAFDHVFSTKIDGWRALLNTTNAAKLKLAIAFTSVAGRFGNLGQCDYAMANEALVHGCLGLSRSGVRALAVDWGPWDGGMVTAALKKNFARQGLTAIPLDLGASALCDELERGTEVEVVIEGPRPNQGTLVRTFDVGSDPWLADHSIDQQPVVPVAVVLEWFAQLASEVYPTLQVVAVRDLAVLKGVILSGQPGSGLDLTVTWEPAAARDGGLALALELLGGPGPLGTPTVHYRAVVDLADQRSQPAPFPGSNGLSKNPYDHAPSDAYDAFLFHGPAFRGIDSIVGISDHGMVGWLKSGGEDALGVGGRWQTDPVAIDSALQLMLLWVRDQTGLGALPNTVREYRQFRAFPARVACHLEVDKLSERRGRFTATLVDEQDNIVAILGGGEYTADPALNAAFRNGK